jgi:hypothetical protein
VKQWNGIEKESIQFNQVTDSGQWLDKTNSTVVHQCPLFTPTTRPHQPVGTSSPNAGRLGGHYCPAGIFEL